MTNSERTKLNKLIDYCKEMKADLSCSGDESEITKKLNEIISDIYQDFIDKLDMIEDKDSFIDDLNAELTGIENVIRKEYSYKDRDKLLKDFDISRLPLLKYEDYITTINRDSFGFKCGWYAVLKCNPDDIRDVDYDVIYINHYGFRPDETLAKGYLKIAQIPIVKYKDPLPMTDQSAIFKFTLRERDLKKSGTWSSDGWKRFTKWLSSLGYMNDEESAESWKWGQTEHFNYKDKIQSYCYSNPYGSCYIRTVVTHSSGLVEEFINIGIDHPNIDYATCKCSENILRVNDEYRFIDGKLYFAYRNYIE